MTLFRPCIDLHEGRVKQIVGASLTDEGAKENHVSPHSAEWFSELYRGDSLKGGHLIKLGPGNEEAALSALASYPDGLQLGGGVNAENAGKWLDAGASHVIVTSFLFEEGELSDRRLDELKAAVPRERLVIDLSCRRSGEGWKVATNRWQTSTSTLINGALMERLSPYCSEFLVHAADVEGLCRGIDEDLVRLLGETCELPCTYAGGARSLADLDRVADLSRGKVDLTFGSALDVFGGQLVKYADCVAYNQRG